MHYDLCFTASFVQQGWLIRVRVVAVKPRARVCNMIDTLHIVFIAPSHQHHLHIHQCKQFSCKTPATCIPALHSSVVMRTQTRQNCISSTHGQLLHVTKPRSHRPRSRLRASNSEERLLLNKTKLEALLAKEGIELSTSSSQEHEVGFSSPAVDWSRYHLQLLFVDRTDTLRARIAAGIFDKIAEWNGFGRAMYTWTSGLEAAAAAAGQPTTVTYASSNTQHNTSSKSMSSSSQYNNARQQTSVGVSNMPALSSLQDTTSHHSSGPAHHAEDTVSDDNGSASRAAAVLTAASALKLHVRDLVRPVDQFELDDLDRYDLVLCLDSGIRDDILAQVAAEHQEYYKEKVCLLTSFSGYECDSVVMAAGGLALLPMQLSFLLRVGPADSSSLKLDTDIHSPSLSSENGSAEWDSMVQKLIWSTAGLAKYLMDAMPEHLSWEPMD